MCYAYATSCMKTFRSGERDEQEIFVRKLQSIVFQGGVVKR
jgi:hypothetical protein